MAEFTIKPITSSMSNLTSPGNVGSVEGQTADAKDFYTSVTDAIDTVAELQTESGQAKTLYEMGAEDDLAKVMLKSQVSGLAFDLALNVRNKVLSAYKDIMSMPV